MFDLGLGEIVLICLVALIFLGPKQIPALARTIGSVMTEFRRGVRYVQNEIDTAYVETEIKKIRPAADSNEPPAGGQG